jgi:hypothetical protein
MAKCAKATEYLPKGLWKSHEQDGDDAVNKFTPGPVAVVAMCACELCVFFCERQGLR